MATQRNPVSDRRASPRVKVHLDCHFTYEGTEYKAFIKDLSSRDAFLWSSFMPPVGAEISIKLESQYFNTPLILQGKTVRQDRKYMKQNTVDAFAVRFGYSSPKVALLISKISNTKTL